MRVFEDIRVGESHDCGTRTVTMEEIIAFAERYDPQPFHIDVAAAERSVYDGVIASGWHVCALTWRPIVATVFGEIASMGAWGIDDLRWHRPVRPGDTLSAGIEAVDKRPSQSRPDRGHVDFDVSVTNGRGEPVMTYVDHAMVARRAPPGGHPGEDG